MLTLDFGTTALKASVGQETVQATYPTHGHTQRPEDWLRAMKEVIAALPTFDAVTLTGQMQDLVCLDESGAPLGPARLYTDGSASAAAAQIHKLVPDWDEITGNEQGATSNAAMYLQQHPEETRHVVFGPAGFIAAQLGLGFHVDITTASTTGLLNLHTREWSAAVTQAAGMEDVLPAISGGVIGTAQANDVGIPVGAPVTLALGDAAFTATSIGPEHVYLGTSGWYAQISQQKPAWPGMFHTLALPEGKVLNIAAVLSAAGTADWARGILGLSMEEAEELLAERSKTRRGWTGIVALPSLHGERFPVREATAGLVGVTAEHTRGDIYAAVLEGVALSLSHAIEPGGVLPVVGGGAHSRGWLEILADVTGRTVKGEYTVEPAASESYAGVRQRQMALYSASVA